MKIVVYNWSEEENGKLGDSERERGFKIEWMMKTEKITLKIPEKAIWNHTIIYLPKTSCNTCKYR